MTSKRMALRAGIGLVGVGALLPVAALSSAGAQTEETASFTFTGEPEDWTVPADVQCVDVVAIGGRGGDGGDYLQGLGGQGGDGASVATTLVVAPGDELTILVGERGVDGTGNTGEGPPPTAGPEFSGFRGADPGSNGGRGGIEDGGDGGDGAGAGGGGGGGLSYVLAGGGPVVIAGAGGGGGAGGPGDNAQENGDGGDGGDGGESGTDGGDGAPVDNPDGPETWGTGGGGATPTSVGAAGTSLGGTEPGPSQLPTAGNNTEGGMGGTNGDGGGGGGAGNLGGGGGYAGFASSGAGGGGGSSIGPDGAVFVTGAATDDGNGSVELTYTAGDTSCVPTTTSETTTTTEGDVDANAEQAPAAQPVRATPTFTG